MSWLHNLLGVEAMRPEPITRLDPDSTDRVLRSLATCLLADLGPRPIAISALEAMLSKYGLTVQRTNRLGASNAVIWPKLNLLAIHDDLSEAEERWQLAECVFHLLLDNASVDGFSCLEESPVTAGLCRRARHGAKFLLCGETWFPAERVDEAAAQWGVTAADLREAILDQI